ncbi:MAG: metal-sensing transcriptional repressor [Tyzzerella sp.]|nr:metal-sensing transcriptional repressor [Tyzzerella sp.]
MAEQICCNRTKHRSEKESKDLITRLKRIEGQVRGIKNMVEEERYCVEILNQVSAVQAALNSFNKELLANHIHSCVLDDIRKGNEEAVDELCETIKKLMK